VTDLRPRPTAKIGLINSLVGIRGVFSAVVVLIHLAPFAIRLTPAGAPGWEAIWHNGYVALDLFFVLSGFVITHGYRTTFSSGVRRGAYGRFLWARLARFYPTHLAVLALLVGAVGVAAAAGIPLDRVGDLGGDLLRHILLTQGWGGAEHLSWNGPTWSLSSEWFCYLVFPFLVPLIIRFRTPLAVLAGYLAAMAVPLVAYGFLGFGDAQITYQAPLWRAAGEFLAGAFLSQLMIHVPRLSEACGRLTGVLASAGIAAIAVLAWAGAPAMLAVPLLGLFVLGLAQQRGRLAAVLCTRPLLVAGDLAVALFLVHVPWLLLATRFVTPQRFPGGWGWLGVVLLIGGAVGVAIVMRALVERPSARVMRRMVPRPSPAPVTVGAAAPVGAPSVGSRTED